MEINISILTEILKKNYFCRFTRPWDILLSERPVSQKNIGRNRKISQDVTEKYHLGPMGRPVF